jgi:hypothetical protein
MRGIRAAKPRRPVQDRLEHRLLVVAALADDLKNFGRGLFPRQPVLQLAELLDVVDGDNGLGGEGFDKGNLVWVKGRTCLRETTMAPIPPAELISGTIRSDRMRESCTMERTAGMPPR